QPRKHLARLNANGTLDLTFNPVTGDDSLTELNAVMVQADGKILAGGSFKSLGGQPRTNLARLTTSQPATQSLSRTGSTLTWLRGASSPEVWRTTFDYSSNGIDWSSLGGGSRIAGGWQLDGLSLPSGGTVRARGFLAASYGNASSGFVETLLGAPVFTTQPLSQTFNAGSTASFNVAATGPEPLSFQWLKDGVPLNDAPGIAGAASPSLRLTNVLKAAEGSYRLVVMNPSGSVTSQVATLTVIDPVILSSPYGCYGEPGQSPTLSVMAGGTALSYQWWKDGTALLQGTSASLTLTNLQLGDAGNYCVVVSNQFGSLTSAVATVRVNLATLDKSFTPAALGSVSPVAMQADGKILVGGAFNSLAGQSRAYLGRLNPEGSLDTSFNPGANATLYSLAVQPDGKILAGGDFTSLAGYSRVGLGRLNPNGTLDTGFSPTILAPPPGYTRTVRVQVILLQPDGKLLIGGRSSLNGGTATGFVYRLNANGTTDTTFVTTGDANGPVASLALQPDGKILVGGLFTYLRSQPRNRLGRLNADGTIDKDFNPNADNSVFALALQADGKILVGGSFATLASQPRTNLARLNPDGTLDSNFALAVTGGSFPTVYSVVVQVDGNILLSGFFTTVAGQARAHLARINSSGGVDPGFNPGPNSFVYGLALQADGNLLAVGDFTVLGGQPRTRIGRLHPTAPATQNLDYDGALVTWLRGGASPEIGYTTFELSTNSTSWTLLGTGTRIAGGWQLSGLPALPAGRIRTRGCAVGGGFNASSWFVEQTLTFDPNTPPSIFTADGGFGFAGPEFGFNLVGPIGRAVVVEGSTNLLNWYPLVTNSFTAGALHFGDPGASNSPSRFYRTRLP
ncbi:MAG TPA: immunoglobulin domain-containing protein, partial [Bacillota bacterium]|nr:immunoglobulin domain-containing protein [Bacillota bacterium]